MQLKRMILILTSFLLISLQSILAATSGQYINRQHKFQSAASSRSLLLSPTPEDYLEIYRVACGNGTGSPGPISKQKLVEHYSSVENERLKQLASGYKIYQECRREPTSWRFNYIDEFGHVLVRERSIDERSANVLYLVRSVKAFSIDIFSYDWEDPRRDEANMNRVAGSKFDDDLCGKQLGQMQILADELSEKTSLLRSNSTFNVELTDQHISLAKILDTYGRYESGRLFGRIFSPGSYYQCRWNKLILNEDEKIGMRFCWAHMSYDRHLAESLKNRKRGKYEHPLNVLFSGICIPESCHSKSFARHKEALQRLVNTQFKMPLSIYADEHMDMSSLYCLVDEDSEYGVPLLGKCLLAFMISWCLLTLSATVWNATIGKGVSSMWQEERQTSLASTGKRGNSVSILEGLDLLESWQDFLRYYTNPSRIRAVQLDAISFFKVFGCAFVVFGHTMALFGGFAMDEIRVARYIEIDWMLCLILAGTLVVDTFFVITGILWAFFALKRLNGRSTRVATQSGHLQSNLSEMKQSIDLRGLDSNNKEGEESKSFSPTPEMFHATAAAGATIQADLTESDRQADVTIVKVESWYKTIRDFCYRWLTYSGFRYLRIVPLYVLVHWFKKYVFIYAGSGPYWDHGFNYKTMSGACIKESPWTPFTFIAAYYPISRQCTLQSWSIANDLFFALIAPPIILLINKRPKMAAYLSFIACAVSYGFALNKISSFPTYLDEELRELRTVGFYRFFDEMSPLYTAPHYRVFNFLAGVWGGYALYYKQDKLDKRQARKQQQALIDITTNQRNNDNAEHICVEFSPQSSNNNVSVPDKIEWPGWLRGLATKLAFGYMILVFVSFGSNESVKHILPGYYRMIYPQFVTSMRVFWALANVVVFLRMMTDWKDNLLMRWSASKFWQVFSKLNYAILLVHLDLLLYSINVSPAYPISFTKWTFFNLGAGIFMLCLPLSIFIHVVFENPFDKLVRSRLPGY